MPRSTDTKLEGSPTRRRRFIRQAFLTVLYNHVRKASGSLIVATC
jgi:hypothetical protein